MSLFDRPRNTIRADPEYQSILRIVGLDADAVFADPRIRVWRKLADRENCTLDEDLGDGTKVRLHIKRYFPAPGFNTAADDEFQGHQFLVDEKIPTAPLVAWGVMADRRSFTIWLDLAGFTPGDKLVAGGFPFERLLVPTADLAGTLHKSGLHHRDLYLCHFMAKPGQGEQDAVEIRLIDTARVRRLPGFLTRRRWIVKDLAQFWYSTTKLPEVTDEQRERWLARYSQMRGDVRPDQLRAAILRKVRAIGRHDRRLNVKEPGRNVSIEELT
jgi:hypothetical protein